MFVKSKSKVYVFFVVAMILEKGHDDYKRIGTLLPKITSLAERIKVRNTQLVYFNRFFSEIVKGRTAYEYLLPLTIGLNQ